MVLCVDGEFDVNGIHKANQTKPNIPVRKKIYIHPDDKYRHRTPPRSIVNDVPSCVPQKPIDKSVLRSCGTAHTDQSAIVAGKRTPCARPTRKRRRKIKIKCVFDIKYINIKARVAIELIVNEPA